ncbi:MAG TPA: PhoX family phosphatase [Acidimicrobiales bacterium]|nr:PhoX family phosphatase [Acidimicrobiales bacterium]
MHHDDTPSNPTTTRPFEEIVAARLSRRSLLVGGVAAAALTLVPGGSVAGAARPANGAPGQAAKRSIGFTSIPLDGGPMPTVAPEYRMQTLIPWREKLDGSGESFAHGTFTWQEQERSVGIGHDGMWYFGDDRRGVLCLNNEFGDNTTVIGKAQPESADDVRLSQAAHGVTVVEVERTSTGWRMVGSPKNRRIHGNSPVAFSGPAAGSALLENGAENPFLGTLNNCANGHTPWGTYLTCEENFNGYFGARGSWTRTPEQARYGLSAGGFGYGWHLFDDRFDLSNPAYANEVNRFGWVVEVDPNRPQDAPVKRTALGRVKHEGATVVEGRGGRAVVYMGDDERFDYIYKFVSRSGWRSMRARGVHPLDEGTLYVARFDEDGTGEWLELSPANPALAGKALDWILVHTRLAADLVGATPMDRPEWVAVGDGEEVFCTLTNNTDRGKVGKPGADAANPLAPNPDGHIIRWVDADHHVGTTFEWDIFAIARDVEDEDGQMFGSPDGIWADPDGRVFVQTDGGQPQGANDQMLVADPVTAEFRRLFTGVVGGEVTGIAVTPDRRTMFVNVQHPGNGDPTLTNFPDDFTGADGPVPRDATVVLSRVDGGVVGS